MNAIQEDEFFIYEYTVMTEQEVEQMVFRNYAFFGILAILRIIFIAH